MDPEVRSDFVRALFSLVSAPPEIQSSIAHLTQRIRRNPLSLSSWSGRIVEIALLQLHSTKGGRRSTRWFMKRLAVEA